ncbi:MAG: acyltransferase family protein [Rikenella sp.]|nr:acyltransferase family protein [Rikenella sp.]
MAQNPSPGRHIPWLDLLRVAACLMVVFSHSGDFFVARFDEDRTAFLSGVLWGSALRACVPLFVMISGVLLLPVRMETGAFYRRRLGRILWPLAVWSILTPLFYWAYGHAEGEHALYDIASFPINFNYATTPLWYLYMLAGLYLILPIVSPWVEQASRRDLKRFLYLWGFTLFIPYLRVLAPLVGYVGNYGHLGILGECDWNPFGTFYYVSGFLGYLILGYYLNRFPSERSKRQIRLRSALCFATGYALTCGGYLLAQRYFPGDYSYLEVPWFFTGFSVFLMTYGVFTALRTVRLSGERTVGRMGCLAGLTFGIYLCHFFIVQVGYDLISAYVPLPPYLQIPIIALVAFGVSAGVVWLLQKLPFHKYLIG